MTDQSTTMTRKSATGKTSVVMRWRMAAAGVGVCFALVAGFFVTDRSHADVTPPAPASQSTSVQR